MNPNRGGHSCLCFSWSHKVATFVRSPLQVKFIAAGVEDRESGESSGSDDGGADRYTRQLDRQLDAMYDEFRERTRRRVVQQQGEEDGGLLSKKQRRKASCDAFGPRNPPPLLTHP